MLDKLRAYKVRFDELQQEIVKPEVIADNKLYKKYTQEYTNITPIVELYEKYNKITNDIGKAGNGRHGRLQLVRDIGRKFFSYLL